MINPITSNIEYKKLCDNRVSSVTVIGRTESIRDLGVMFDSTLSFSSHIEYTTNKSYLLQILQSWGRKITILHVSAFKSGFRQSSMDTTSLQIHHPNNSANNPKEDFILHLEKGAIQNFTQGAEVSRGVTLWFLKILIEKIMVFNESLEPPFPKLLYETIHVGPLVDNKSEING